jgi:hypothetical protein
MATRSQQFKAEAERKHPASAPVTGETTPTAPHGHAEKKAVYAREAPPAGIAGTARPSRKSTRKSANRAKTDASLQHSVQNKENTAESRHQRSHDTGVRGGGAP